MEHQIIFQNSTSANDGYGYSIAIHGNYLAVGAQNTEISGYYKSGSVYLYHKSG